MKRLPRSRLFLLELTIDLVFFCVCAAVCLTLLARAGALTRQSDELGGALLAAENAAETFAAVNGDAAQTALKLGAVLGEDGLALSFDETWAPIAETDAAYRLTMRIDRPQERLAAAFIEVTRLKDGGLVYQLETKRFVKGVGQ